MILGIVECKQVAALLKAGGIRGVEIFGLGVVHHATAEGNNISRRVDDGKDNTITEIIVGTSRFLRLTAEEALDQLLVGKAERVHMLLQNAEAVWCKAKSESLYYNRR